MSKSAGQYYVYSGQGKAPFRIPSGWSVLQNAACEEGGGSTADLQQRLASALSQPEGSRNLFEIVNEESKVALIVDDNTRPTPLRLILPAILDEVRRGGVKTSNIDIVVALGTHQPVPEESIAKRIGEDIFRQYRVSQHDCRAQDLVAIGHLSTGMEVKINPIVARADVKIGIGSILPHPMNGFGGGGKLLFPGVANFAAIKEHHLYFTTKPGTCIGTTATNSFYHEVSRIAEIAQLNFIVNCMFNSQEEVVDVVAGDMRKAHLIGIEKSKALLGYPIDQPADVTITSSFPYVSGPQIIKPLVPCSLLATKPGGAIIMVASCNDKLPEPMLKAFDAIYAANPKDTGRLAIETFESSRLFYDGAVDFNCAIFFSMVCAARNRITLVTNDLEPLTVRRLGLKHAGTLEEAIDEENRLQPRATVHVFPKGGLFLPLTQGLPSLGG